MTEYAGIIVDISLEKLDRIFDYSIPERLKYHLEIGQQVWIPFGRGNRQIKGYVLTIGNTTSYDPAKVKEIIDVCDNAVLPQGKLIALACWLQREYGATLNQCLKTVLPVKAKVKQLEKHYISLNVSIEEAEQYIQREKKAKARVRVIQALIQAGEGSHIDEIVLKDKLKTTRDVIDKLIALGLICEQREINYRNPKIKRERQSPFSLNDSQKAVINTFSENESQGIHKTYLLHGVTGSGKTEVYIKMIEDVIASGRQAIVLIPEIALTFQMVMRFCNRFGDRVSIINSRMSKGERYDAYIRACQGLTDVMIGPRSAVFTPFPNLGIIIMDEEHESSYKSEGMPRYHAREVASFRAEYENATLVLGSATPSIESYYKAMNGEYVLCELTERIGGRAMAQTEVVDLRQELKEGNRSMFSSLLTEQITQALSRKEQIMLFINRRGYAGFITCRSCGEVVKCPHCDVSLALHKDGKLKCHYCGYERENISTCPKCGSKYIGAFRAGTQQVEQAVNKSFPDARTLRMDMDTTRGKDGHQEILEAFASHEADILIGTQMIVKGHDFPNVTLIGILLADLSLHDGDYMAAEKTFQLLTQAAGRAGRGDIPGMAVIQTYKPEHYSIQAAARQDYKEFYRQEIAYRDIMSYPPVYHMLAVIFGSASEELMHKTSDKVKNLVIQAGDKRAAVIGPAAPYVGKISDIYREVLYVKHDNREVLRKIRRGIEQMVLEKHLSDKVMVMFDINPVHL